MKAILSSLLVFGLLHALLRPYIHLTHVVQRGIARLFFPAPGNGTSYDFVVVGAGAAGCTVAARLAENGKHSVLLLEAGGPSHWLMGVPFFMPAFLTSPYDWDYLVEPQSNTMGGISDRRPKWYAGKVLGGSSMLNAMLYLRGHRDDYDEWASMGCDGWGYDDVLPYFKKSEGFQPGFSDDTEVHGTKGPLKVEQPFFSKYGEIFHEAAEEMGLKFGDPSGDGQNAGSSFYSRVYLDNGWRTGTYQSFARDKRGLRVVSFAEVQKIIFEAAEDEPVRAVGVKVVIFGQTHYYKVNKEVILSAGAVGSPKLLLLSGIGAEENLTELEIIPRVDLPGVGHNLQDHLYSVVHVESKATYTKDLWLGRDIFAAANPLNVAKVVLGAKGPLTDTGWPYQALLNVNSPNGHGSRRPDVQLITGSQDVDADYGIAFWDIVRLNRSHYEAIYPSDTEGQRDGAMIMPVLLHPMSRGYVKLKSKDPAEPPIIQPNYLAHPRDMETLIEGMKYAQRLATTKTMRVHGIEAWPPDRRNCGKYEAYGDAYWECYLREYSFTLHHASGTCKMGTDDDRHAVVDTKLRVRGTTGLRVVDASIMPTIVGGNTMAATVMIGEKAADVILEAWDEENRMEEPATVSAVERRGDTSSTDTRQNGTSLKDEL